MNFLRSRHIEALGTLLFGVALVVGPVLKAFSESCPRQEEGATEAKVVVGTIASTWAPVVSPLERPCPDGADSHVGAAVSAEMARWTVEVESSPAHAGDRQTAPPVSERKSLEKKPPGPVVETDPVRSVVLQV